MQTHTLTLKCPLGKSIYSAPSVLTFVGGDCFGCRPISAFKVRDHKTIRFFENSRK